MEYALIVVLLLSWALVAWLEKQHWHERRAWEKERTALLERAVPGLVIRAEVEVPNPKRRFGDEAEWEIEQRRNGSS